MKTKIEKLPKSTIKLSVTVEKEKVKEAYDSVLQAAVNNTTLQGFRKGNAPKDMVEKHIGVSSLYGEAINEVLKTYYPQALKEHSITPISNPKVEIKEFDMEKDMEFTAEVAIRPEVKLGDYKKDLVKKYKDRQKEKAEAEKKATKDKKPEESKPTINKMSPNDAIEVVVTGSKVEISELLIEEETDRLLSRLLQQIQGLGMSLEQYLKAQNKTNEDLRADYKKLAENNIKAEFVLAELVKEEKIEVEEKEIEEMINAVGDKDTQVKMQDDPMQKAYIKMVLQKNKLLAKLIEIAEGEKKDAKK